jgi:hypothetical protein
MPRKQHSIDDIKEATDKLVNLGHVFKQFHTYNRVEYQCGNCGKSSISSFGLAYRIENKGCCYYCDALKKITKTVSKNGDEIIGVRLHETKGKHVFVIICQTCSTRYENVTLERSCLDCSNDKRKQTNISKYGASNVFASKEIKEKIVKSNQERHGVNYPMQNKEIREKMTETNLKKYGHKYAFNQPHVYEKIQETHTENHGTPFPFQSPLIRDKMKKNSLAKFGTEHPCQNANELERRFKLMFRLKDYTFPSGVTINVQGYEDMCLNMLLEIYSEDQLIADSKAIPHIKYTDKAQKTRKYIPDILVKESDESFFYIEVKSLYTYMLNYEKNISKYTACLEQGIPLMIWIFHSDKQGPIENDGKRYKLYRHSYIDGVAQRFDDGPEASLIPMTLNDYTDLSAQKPEKKTEYTVLCRKMKTALATYNVTEYDSIQYVTDSLGAMAI